MLSRAVLGAASLNVCSVRFVKHVRAHGSVHFSGCADIVARALGDDSAFLWDTTRALVEGLLSGDRSCLARSITLIESTRPDHRAQAELLLDVVLAARRGRWTNEGESGTERRAVGAPPGLPPTFRLGIAGPPGAGKSTLIESLGMHIVGLGEGERVAVMAVDPSSSRSGGSILGDKTRMEQLSRHPRAFVRPSPTRGALGGVARDTHDVVLLAEGAGYGTVMVETVGLGQSEIAVESVVDMLILVVPPGGGDELQGSKKGIVEVADVIVVNKADGALAPAARQAKAEYGRAMQLARWKHAAWQPRVLLASAMTGTGVSELWSCALDFRATLGRTGALMGRRREQGVAWMWLDFERTLLSDARARSVVKDVSSSLTLPLARGTITPRRAARALMDAYREGGAGEQMLTGKSHAAVDPK